jgi:hypothetical protein
VMDPIGLRGQLSGAASCTESRGRVSGVGGWLAWPRSVQFQSHCRRSGARRGRLGASRCRARLVSRWGLSAVQACVQCELGKACMHGNASHALRALGGTIVSEWHGQGAVHGRSRSGAAWQIDHGGRRGAGGEVTTRGGCNTQLFVMHVKTKLMLYSGETKTFNKILCACVHEC